MKCKMIINKTFALLLSIILVFSLLATASAGTSISGGTTINADNNSDLANRLRSVPDFKFKNHENGIGYGNCPVYTAPSEYAYRCADGKASCYTDAYMSEAGFDITGWLLVRYQTNNGGTRVGYIPPKYVKGFKSVMSGCQHFEYIPVIAADTICVTDNPLLPGSAFATLDQGETFYILAKYTYYGNWWYIECTVDGQMARGFIDRGTTSFYLGDSSSSTSYQSPINQQSLGNPTTSPLGTSQIGEVLVGYGSTGSRKIVRERPDPNSRQVTVVYPGQRYPCYAEQQGSTGKTWYYIWVETDSAWAWISSGYVTFFE